MNRKIEIAVQAVLNSIQEEAKNVGGCDIDAFAFNGSMQNITKRDYTDTIEVALNNHEAELQRIDTVNTLLGMI